MVWLERNGSGAGRGMPFGRLPAVPRRMWPRVHPPCARRNLLGEPLTGAAVSLSSGSDLGRATHPPTRTGLPADGHRGESARSWLTGARGRCVRSHRLGRCGFLAFARAALPGHRLLVNEITPTYFVRRAPGVQLLPVHLGSRARAGLLRADRLVVAEQRARTRDDRQGMRTRGRCPGGTVGHPRSAGVRSGKMREGPIAGTVGEGREPVFVGPRRFAVWACRRPYPAGPGMLRGVGTTPRRGRAWCRPP
jgi:hypothetical protein